MKSIKIKIFTILAFCLAFVMSLGVMLIFDSDKKVYAEEAYFMAVEKYRLPVDDNGLPDLQSILNQYQIDDSNYIGSYLYDSIEGKISDNSIDFDTEMTFDNWTSIFLKLSNSTDNPYFVNIVDFLREISYCEQNFGVELVQTLATSDTNIAERYNIAMLKTENISDGYREYVIVSFLPMGQHAKLTYSKDNENNSIYTWSFAAAPNGNTGNFQTFTVNANLNGVSIKAQTQYQSLVGAKKFYEFATDLSNVIGADESEAYPKYDAQGHYTFEFTYTDNSGAGSSLRPTANFYALNESYYLNNTTINEDAKVQPKLWNIQKNIERDYDDTNIQPRDKKEYDYFGYNNSVTIDYDGNSTQPNDYENGIQYPTITFDPTRYTLSYYFVDRSLESGALQIVTSELKFVEDQLVLELSNGKQFEVKYSPIIFNENTADEWTNEIYEVNVEVQDLGKYVFQFDFALNKIDIQNKSIENYLPEGATKINNSLERDTNWDWLRDEQYQTIGTDELTIYGYQLFYSVYNENGNTIAELKKVDDGYYADVTNLYDNGTVNVYTDNESNPIIPSTNQPPLFFRYGEGQTLSSITFNRYSKFGDANPINENPTLVDNIYRFASTGRESLDNGYYEVFVTYNYGTKELASGNKIENVINSYTQIFAFEVKYTSPTINFYTIDTENQTQDWTGIGFTNQKVKIDWSQSLTNQSPFDVQPTTKIVVTKNPNNATIQMDDENPGIAYLSVKNNTYATFSFTIEWGPINANRPSKTYTFTIDKTDIKDFVKLAIKEQNNYAFFDGIITNSSQVRALYGQNLSTTEEPNATKDSGAGISMTYTLLQMSANNNNPQIVNNSITNGYEISNLLENNAYVQYIGEGESRKPNHLPDVNAVFVLNFVDDAGNTYTRYLIVDHTSPKILYRIADQNGNFPTDNQGWMELTYNNNYIKTNAEIYYGNYKAITIDTTNTEIVETLAQFANDANVKIEINHLLVKLNNSKVSETVLVSKENQTNLPPKYSYDILGNSTVGMLIISFDSIQLEGNLSGNYPNNIQNIGNLDGYGTRTQSSDAMGLYSNGISTRQYLKLKWKVLEENYVVEKVEYEYYPFDLTSNSLTNPNYPFSASPDAVEPTIVYERNNDAFNDLKVDENDGNLYTNFINISTGNKDFSGGTATKQGLYVVTRIYNHAQFEHALADKVELGQEELDTEVRKYYFYIDRNNILTQIGDRLVTSTRMQIAMGNGDDLSTFGGTSFLDDVLNTNGYVITTNKQPISTNIPLKKYDYETVVFEGYDYIYDQETSQNNQIHYKFFFMDNGSGNDSGLLTVLEEIAENKNTYTGTYRKNNDGSIKLSFDNREINANAPLGNGISDENCKNLNFDVSVNFGTEAEPVIHQTRIYAKRYTQNMLYYQYDICSDIQDHGKDFNEATGETTINNANGATETKYIYTICINDIDNLYVRKDATMPFNKSINNGLVFRFEVNLEKPQARWIDETGLVSTENQNTNTVKLVWNTFDKDLEYFANIEETDITVQKQIYVNGQIQTIDLGKFVATNDNMNSIALSDVEIYDSNAKYLFKIKYKGAEYYYDFGQETKVLNYDKTKPYYNFTKLFNDDKFLNHLSAEEIAGFEDFNSDINFENYAFVPKDGEDWTLTIPSASKVYEQNPEINIAYDKLFVSQTDDLDRFDLDAAWYRKYNKKYNGTNPENLQSIVPGDSRYGENDYANYMFDPNLTKKIINEQSGEEITTPIYTPYNLIDGSRLFAGENGNYYEIIERDIAGNYRIYTVFITNDSTRKIDFDLDQNYTISAMADDGTYIVREKDEDENTQQTYANIAKNTEINSLINTPLVIKDIIGLGEYYDVTIENLAIKSQAITIRRTKNADILSQINAAIQSNFSNGKNGNNFKISFFAPTDEYIINYRTESELNVMYVSATNTLTFSIDESMGSYIKSMQVKQDGNVIYNLGDNYVGDLFTLTMTASGSKITYMLKFNAAENNGTQLKYEYVDNFNKIYKDFKVIGIENTNFDYNPNDTTGSNMLIFGNGISSANYDQINNPEMQPTPDYDETFEFTKVAEFYTGESVVKFRYQTKVYSNVKIYEVKDNDEFRQLKNLPSSTSSTNFKNTTQIYNNNNENVDTTYLITFVDPIGNTYEYIIHHYTMLAEISFENDDFNSLNEEDRIIIDETNKQVTDVFTMYITNQPELYPTVVTATRTVNNTTTNLGTIRTGYPFNLPGTYVVTASNQVGLIKTFVFTYIEGNYSNYTVTATSLNGITRLLMPNEKIKYEYENGYIDLYFALKSEAVNITLGSKDFVLSDPNVLPSQNDGTTISIYEITSKKISTYSKKFAIIQVKASTDLLLGEMNIDDRYISASTLSVQSISKVVTLKIHDYYRNSYNKLIIKAKYNGRDLGEIDGILDENGEYRTFNFDVAGDYVLSISDQAGNMHLFNDTTQYFTLSVLNNISYRINGKEPIKNSYYNDPVVLNVLNLTKFYADKNQPYVTEVVTLNGRVIDNTQYSKVNNGTYYTYTFSQYGSYNVEFTGYVRSVSEENKVVTNATFTILNQNQARIIHEYIGLNGYRVVSILKDNEDITNQIKQKSGTAILNQFALVGGTGKNIVGGNGRYTITVSAYLGNFVGYQEFTYNVWLNNETTALIESSIAPGSSTTKSIYLKMNLYQIYSKIGECKIKLNGKDYITINSSTATENLISTYELTSNKSYYISVETDNGNTLLSFVVTKKEPLNTVAIIVSVTVSVVGTALAVTFVLLRKRMRVR